MLIALLGIWAGVLLIATPFAALLCRAGHQEDRAARPTVGRMTANTQPTGAAADQGTDGYLSIAA